MVDAREIKSKRSLISSFVASIGVAFFVRLGVKNWLDMGTGWDYGTWGQPGDWGSRVAGQKVTDTKETSDDLESRTIVNDLKVFLDAGLSRLARHIKAYQGIGPRQNAEDPCSTLHFRVLIVVIRHSAGKSPLAAFGNEGRQFHTLIKFEPSATS